MEDHRGVVWSQMNNPQVARAKVYGVKYMHFRLVTKSVNNCPTTQYVLSAAQYVGPDVYQFWNLDTHPSFSYSKTTLGDKN